VPVVTASRDSGVDREKLIMEIADGWKPSGYNDDLRYALIANLNAYSDELLERLASGELGGPFPTVWVRSSVMNASPENEINEQLEFYPLLGETTRYIAQNMLQSLHGYPGYLDGEDLTQEGDAVKGKCRAMLLVTEALNSTAMDAFKDEKPIFVIKDERLVELVINNSDKAELIVNFIQDRARSNVESLDVDLLADVIASDAPSVSSGLL
jgi:hypothetical protein